MSENLSVHQWRERYREAQRVDRENFRLHWRKIAFMAFLSLVGNACLGYAVGLFVAMWSIAQALHSIPFPKG